MLSDAKWRRMLAEATEFERAINGVVFRLRIPTRAELRGIVIEHGGMADDAARARAMAATLLAALVSAAGVKASDLGLSGDEALPETAEVARAYVNEHLDVMDELSEALNERMAKRIEALDADLKN